MDLSWQLRVYCGLALLLFRLPTLPAAAQSRLSAITTLSILPASGHYTDLEERYPLAPIYVSRELKATVIVPAVGLSYDQALYAFSPDQAIGVTLGATIGLTLVGEQAQGLNTRLLLDFPEYVTWRYGTRATRKTELKKGVGVGFGYRWAKFYLPFNSPSFMVDYAFNSGHFTESFVRLSADLRAARFYSYFSSEGMVESLRFREIALTFGRSF